MLTPEEVRHISQLARVGMTEDDVQRFQAQLSQILEHFEMLRQLDTEGVPATTSVVPLHDVMRDDVEAPSLSVEDVLRNAPQRDGDSIRVRIVLE